MKQPSVIARSVTQGEPKSVLGIQVFRVVTNGPSQMGDSFLPFVFSKKLLGCRKISTAGFTFLGIGLYLLRKH